jgi:type II secretory pathway pseudopilin PulG
MRLSSITPKSRSAFTIVELMVAMALIVFIMVILSEAFKAGIDTFRKVRAAGDLQERLRSATTMLRKDLSSRHFEIGRSPRGGPNVRDQRLDRESWHPPEQGFFRIWQVDSPLATPPNPSIREGSDSDGINFSRGTTTVLHFTSKLDGILPGDAHLGLAPGGFSQPAFQDLPAYSEFPNVGATGRYASRWGEIAYFLAPAINPNNNLQYTSENLDGQPAQPLFALYRRVRVVPPDQLTARVPRDVNHNRFDVSASANDVTGVNRIGTTTYHSTLPMLADPRVRMNTMNAGNIGGYPSTAGSTRPLTMFEEDQVNNAGIQGNDLILTDVISFEVKATWVPYRSAVFPNERLPFPRTIAQGNTDAPFDDLPNFYYNPTTDTQSQNPGAGFIQVYKNTTFFNQRVRVYDTWGESVFLNPTNGAPITLNWDSPQRTAATQVGFMEQHEVQVPLRIRIQALQIKLRIWDVKTQTTRQVTLIQEI